MVRKLPTFEYQGKNWTMDERLGEFRHLVYGELPQFIPFDNDLGSKLLRAYRSSVRASS